MKKTETEETDDLIKEYRRDELGKGVRGKYYEAYKQGSNVVLLSPDVAKAFPNSDAVNEALRGVMKLSELTRKFASH